MGRSAESREVGRRLSREAKRRRTGTCEDCGAVTRYAGHGISVSPRCHPCAVKHVGLAKRGDGPLSKRLLALLDRGPMRFTEIHTALGIPKNNMGSLICPLMRYGLIERPARGWYRRAA